MHFRSDCLHPISTGERSCCVPAGLTRMKPWPLQQGMVNWISFERSRCWSSSHSASSRAEQLPYHQARHGDSSISAVFLFQCGNGSLYDLGVYGGDANSYRNEAQSWRGVFSCLELLSQEVRKCVLIGQSKYKPGGPHAMGNSAPPRSALPRAPSGECKQLLTGAGKKPQCQCW